MNNMNNYDVEGARGLLTYQGRTLISVSDGQRLGAVDDVLIDPGVESGNLRLHAVLTVKSGLLRPEVNAVMASDVFLWGQDVVLVKDTDALIKRDSMPRLENCLSAYHSIPWRDVISQNGDRLAEMSDLLITPQGHLAGFVAVNARGELAELLGQRRGERRLPVSVIQSFGRDVLILDLHKLRDMTPPALTSPEEVN